jgi:hypothetical protein
MGKRVFRDSTPDDPMYREPPRSYSPTLGRELLREDRAVTQLERIGAVELLQVLREACRRDPELGRRVGEGSALQPGPGSLAEAGVLRMTELGYRGVEAAWLQARLDKLFARRRPGEPLHRYLQGEGFAGTRRVERLLGRTGLGRHRRQHRSGAQGGAEGREPP